MSRDKEQRDGDPRAYTDKRILEQHSREEVERWRDQAQKAHRQWMEVMRNDYGKD